MMMFMLIFASLVPSFLYSMKLIMDFYEGITYLLIASGLYQCRKGLRIVFKVG